MRNGKATGKRRKRPRQRGGFLNRHDFAYAGRDIVNQLGKIAPDIINQTTGQIDKIAGGAAEVERILPKIVDKDDQSKTCIKHHLDS